MRPEINSSLKVFPKLHLAEDDLWRQILWGPTKGPGPALYSLGKTKICDL